MIGKEAMKKGVWDKVEGSKQTPSYSVLLGQGKRLGFYSRAVSTPSDPWQDLIGTHRT